MALDGRLDVDVTGDAVEFAFEVTNAGDEPIELEFRSGLRADFEVRAGDDTVWRWSDGRLFTQALHAVTLDPGESLGQEGVWPTPEPGTYRAVATLEATDADLARTVEFAV